jgi:hypothetical protein
MQNGRPLPPSHHWIAAFALANRSKRRSHSRNNKIKFPIKGYTHTQLPSPGLLVHIQLLFDTNPPLVDHRSQTLLQRLVLFGSGLHLYRWFDGPYFARTLFFPENSAVTALAAALTDLFGDFCSFFFTLLFQNGLFGRLPCILRFLFHKVCVIARIQLSVDFRTEFRVVEQFVVPGDLKRKRLEVLTLLSIQTLTSS